MTELETGNTAMIWPLVELVDTDGRAIGTVDKLTAHQAPGLRHRAFSVFLLDRDGRLMIQRRASTKYHSAGRWSNTCCGHPMPGETPGGAALRRVAEELGIQLRPDALRDAGVVSYAVSDGTSGLVESEYDHLLVGSVTARARPDPREVAAVEAVALDAFEERLAGGEFSAWFPIVLESVLPALRALLAQRTVESGGSPRFGG